MKNCIKFTCKEYPHATLIEFELTRPIEPTELPEIVWKFKTLKVPYHKGIILSGRGPIWLYGALLHEAHPCRWLAVWEPRMNAGVIVASHVKDFRVGDRVGLNGDNQTPLFQKK